MLVPKNYNLLQLARKKARDKVLRTTHIENNHEGTVPSLITFSVDQWLVLPEPATPGKYHGANEARSHSNANPNAHGSIQGE